MFSKQEGYPLISRINSRFFILLILLFNAVVKVDKSFRSLYYVLFIRLLAKIHIYNFVVTYVIL